jgi:hypothetical protein
MIPEIKDPEDWHHVNDIIRKMMRDMPMFYHDYNLLTKNIEKLIKDLGLIDIELRKKTSVAYVEKRKEKLEEINVMIRTFSKIYLIARLAKR